MQSVDIEDNGAYHSLEVKQILLDCCPAHLHWRIAQLQYNDRCGFRYCSHFLPLYLTRFLNAKIFAGKESILRAFANRIDLHLFLHIPLFLQVFTIHSFIHPFFPLKMSDVFQISSHGISFSSDIILKTSHEILFLWEDIEKNSWISPFFVGGLILNPRKIH